MPNRPEFQIRYGTGKKQGLRNTGAMKKVREAKRAEAELRNANSPERKRRSHWRGLGFVRESHAAQVVRKAVAEGNVISRTIIPDFDKIENIAAQRL
jgi:hypothetical protein